LPHDGFFYIFIMIGIPMTGIALNGSAARGLVGLVGRIGRIGGSGFIVLGAGLVLSLVLSLSAAPIFAANAANTETTSAAVTNVATSAAASESALEPIKVVYHIADGNDQARRALANIANHLRAEPATRIVVVALGNGIEFMLSGTVDRYGRPFEPEVLALAAQGVQFRVCRNSMLAHDVAASRLLAPAVVVPAGVAEIARLQAREGYVYLRP